jgi:hypothetical protein
MFINGLALLERMSLRLLMVNSLPWLLKMVGNDKATNQHRIQEVTSTQRNTGAENPHHGAMQTLGIPIRNRRINCRVVARDTLAGSLNLDDFGALHAKRVGGQIRVFDMTGIEEANGWRGQHGKARQCLTK